MDRLPSSPTGDLDLLQFNQIAPNYKVNKFLINEKGGRPLLIDHTSTTHDIGPGKYEELRSFFPQIGRRESAQSVKQSSPTFKSNSPRLSPLFLSVAPIPGAYSYKTIIDEILSKKRIGKNGKFFTTAQKFYKHAVDV
jgi:hypothetical protein